MIKGDGGWATSHAEIARQRGLFEVPCDMLMYKLGTNDPTLAAFQANFPNQLSWMQEMKPNAKKLMLTPPPRQGSAEAVMVSIRSYIMSTAAALNDPKIKACDLGSAYSNADDTYFFTGDGTTSGARVHPKENGHAAIAAAVKRSWWRAATILKSGAGPYASTTRESALSVAQLSYSAELTQGNYLRQ